MLVLTALALLHGNIDRSTRGEGLGHQIAVIQIETTLSSYASFQRLGKGIGLAVTTALAAGGAHVVAGLADDRQRAANITGANYLIDGGLIKTT